jgi:signal peptidase I
MVNPWHSTIIKWIQIILFSFLIVLFIRIFIADLYKISSISMEPTIIPGDKILVSKINYCIRFLNPFTFIKDKRTEYLRLKSWGSVKKEDIVVFYWPRYKELSDSDRAIYGDCIVKRCVGLPGETIRINNTNIKKYSRYDEPGNTVIFPQNQYSKSLLFPYDSTLNWTISNYGPLYVPKKEGHIKLSNDNIRKYKDILKFENPKIYFFDNYIMINNKKVTEYLFKNNYYFMLGDNISHSIDSRYWGFVPEGHIIGKAFLILYSTDQFNEGIHKLRWERFFNRL